MTDSISSLESKQHRLAYIPGLDGLRGLLVLLGPIIFHARPDFLPGGILAIDVFFVISSYLITSIALQEWHSTGRIDLVAYAGRRVRRLVPALLIAITSLALYLAIWADKSLITRWTGSLVSTLSYSANWFEIFSGVSYFQQFDNPSPMYHAWSFAIEEQFYLFAPFFLLFCLKFFRSHGVRVLISLSAFFALASAATMSILYTGGDPTRVYYGTDTRAHALFIGMALAGVLYVRGNPRTAVGRGVILTSGYIGVMAFGIAVFTISAQSSWMFNYGGFLGIAVIAAAMIVAISQPSKGPLHLFCQWGPLRWLGRISYGVYLFHWPIYLVVITPRRLETTGGFVIGLALTVAIAALSFHFIEQPIMRRRTPFSVRRLVPWPTFAAALMVMTVAFVALLSANANKPPDIQQVLIPAPPSANGSSASNELRILIVGDSVSRQIGEALTTWATTHVGKIVVYNKSHDGCVITRYGLKRLPGGEEGEVGDLCSAWDVAVSPEKLSDPNVISWVSSVAQFRPDVVIGYITAWDACDRLVPSLGPEWTHVGISNFDEYAKKEYRLATEVLTSTGAKMIWLTGAHVDRVITPQNDPSRIDALNELVVDATVGLRVEFGDFPTFIGPVGAKRDREIRRDGLHLSDNGKTQVATWLTSELLGVG
ncbi:MAG: acyltransferase [Ilumatobacteraceae bacterium]|nr:acyltransferase [Ilumatobacteraceae bacterium]